MSKRTRGWKASIYSAEKVNVNPAGDVFRELAETELDAIAAGGTANTVCACHSGENSCGRLCTGSGECPIMTLICC